MKLKTCNKATYNTRKGAKKFLRRYSLQYKQRAYLCDICGWYHNTSIDSYARRDIKEFYRKGE